MHDLFSQVGQAEDRPQTQSARLCQEPARHQDTQEILHFRLPQMGEEPKCAEPVQPQALDRLRSRTGEHFGDERQARSPFRSRDATEGHLHTAQQIVFDGCLIRSVGQQRGPGRDTATIVADPTRTSLWVAEIAQNRVLATPPCLSVIDHPIQFLVLIFFAASQ